MSADIAAVSRASNTVAARILLLVDEWVEIASVNIIETADNVAYIGFDPIVVLERFGDQGTYGILRYINALTLSCMKGTMWEKVNPKNSSREEVELRNFLRREYKIVDKLSKDDKESITPGQIQAANPFLTSALLDRLGDRVPLKVDIEGLPRKYHFPAALPVIHAEFPPDSDEREYYSDLHFKWCVGFGQVINSRQTEKEIEKWRRISLDSSDKVRRWIETNMRLPAATDGKRLSCPKTRSGAQYSKG